jgi:hypothetical protein
MSHLGDLMYSKCMFMQGDHISTTTNPSHEIVALNCRYFTISLPKASSIWNQVPLAGVRGFKLWKLAQFHFKNLAQIGTGFSCYGLPGKFDGSEVHVHARGSHIHCHKPLAGVGNFIMGKPTGFCFKNLFQFGTGFSCYGAPQKSDAFKMHVHAWWSHIHHQEPTARASSLKLRKLLGFCFKNLVQFRTGFMCHGSPGKFDASKMHPQAQWSHIYHREPLAEVWGLKLRKSAEFCFKNLVQFGARFRHYGSTGKSDDSEIHLQARWSHIHHREPLAGVERIRSPLEASKSRKCQKFNAWCQKFVTTKMGTAARQRT